MLKKSNELGPGTTSLISCELRVHLRAECELQACEKPAHTKKVSPLHATGNYFECRQFCGDQSVSGQSRQCDAKLRPRSQSAERDG